MNHACLISVFWLLAACPFAGAQSPSSFDPVGYVDPFIGTDAHGHTFPGAALPFGMVQISPDTRLEGWDGCSGYHFSDRQIYGFSHTHLSGTGVPDYCDVLLMPVTGQVHRGPERYASSFQKNNETAEAGYYSVVLDQGNIRAELTATLRTGIHRYTVPPDTRQYNVLIDLHHRDKLLGGEIRQIGPDLLVGRRFSRSWADDQQVYFAIRFSQPIAALVRRDSAFASLAFTNTGKPLVALVGLSGVDTDGALRNLQQEAPHFDFDRYRREARDAWSKSLSRLRTEGGSATQNRVFYTALYHTLLAPNLFTDVDGRYRGHDRRVHLAKGHQVYTVFSLWDTYRACKPLYTLLEPERMNDFIQSFLRQYEQSGLLPVWELAGNETNCMIGYHSVPVIADAWRKGICQYDGALALQAMIASASQNTFGLDAYRKYGYIPADMEGESVSKTLEYAYDDWCIAQMAKMLGDDSLHQEYLQRAQYWKNMYNPDTGFFQGKKNASWQSPFDPYEVNFNFTEANAWQYRFATPQDVNTLMRWMGGPEAFARELDRLFSAKPQTSGREQADITGLIGQYAHGNEPSHHMAYLYNFAGQPSKTQHYVRRIMDELYTDRPDGLCGNEDVGQMSAWLVFSALGFYPLTPASNTYITGTPWFEKVTWRLGNGKELVIEAPGASNSRYYVANLAFNGREQPNSFLRHEMLAQGGTLRFFMSDKPSAWATRTEDCPVQEIFDAPIVPAPFVAQGERVFREKQRISLGCVDPEAKIWYTTDGSAPSSVTARTYEQPFEVTQNTSLRMVACKGDRRSHAAAAEFSIIDKNTRIHRYNSAYTSPYTGGGPDGLIDRLRGGADFRSGGWQGFQGVDADVVLDLGALQPVHRISLGVLQDENAWIFFPVQLRVEYSTDGVSFQPLGTAQNTVGPEATGALQQELAVPADGQKARFIRVVAQNPGVCPPFHKGAGHPCWVFLDEITVE